MLEESPFCAVVSTPPRPGTEPHDLVLAIVKHYKLEPGELKNRYCTRRQAECRSAVIIALHNAYPKQSLHWCARFIGRSVWTAYYILGMTARAKRNPFVMQRLARLTEEFYRERGPFARSLRS
jgi:hypothetical protein